MITNTFLHIRGISKRQEEVLWQQGVTDWTLFAKDAPVSRHSALNDSIDALSSGDAEFFARALPKAEHYRIALEFPDDVLFLHAETTGSSLYYDSLTMVGWSFGKTYNVYVAGEDSSSFVEAMRRAKAVVTFNGTVHDCKFIQKHFPEILPKYRWQQVSLCLSFAYADFYKQTKYNRFRCKLPREWQTSN